MTAPRTPPLADLPPQPPPDQLAAAIWSKAEAAVMEAAVTMTSGLSTPVDVGGAPGRAIHQLPDAVSEVLGEYTKEYGELHAGDGVPGAGLRAASGFSGEAAEAMLEIVTAAATPVLHFVGDAVQGAGEVGGHLDMAVSALADGQIGETMGHLYDAAATTLSTAGKLAEDVPEGLRGALVVAGEILEGGAEMTEAAIEGVFGLGGAIYEEITSPEVDLLDEVRDILLTDAVPSDAGSANVTYPGDDNDSAIARDASPDDAEAQVCYPGDGGDDDNPSTDTSDEDDD